MLIDKAPVEAVVRAGIGTGYLGGLVTALLTVIPLLLDVFSARRIWLAGNYRVITVQRHSQRVRKLNPLIGVYVDSEVPVTDLHDV